MFTYLYLQKRKKTQDRNELTIFVIRQNDIRISAVVRRNKKKCFGNSKINLVLDRGNNFILIDITKNNSNDKDENWIK